jgi:predicted site-specific integrase-resolvase
VLWLCRQRGVEVIIIEADAQQSFEQGLSRGVLEIITVFSSRLYGQRSHRRRSLKCPDNLMTIAA